MSTVRQSDPWPRLCIFAAALSVAAGVAPAQPSVAVVPTAAPPIHLQSRVVEPTAETPAVRGDEFGRVHLLASFTKPITREQIRGLRALGVAVLDRCPVNAYVLSVPQDLLQHGALLHSLPEGTRLAPLRPADKLSPGLLPKGADDPPKVPPYTARRDDRVEAIVLFFGDLREEGLQTRLLSQHGAKPLQRLSAINGWRVALPEEEIIRLAQRDPVKWVEEGPPPPHDDNQEVRGPDGVNADVVQSAASGYGLSGQGVVIAQWEGTNASVAHKDLAPRVTLGDTVVPPETRFYRYADAADDEGYNGGEPFYLDVDDSLTVTPGDWRAATVGMLTPGIVQPGDADITVQATKLRELSFWYPPFEAFLDSSPANNKLFEPGEAIYLEEDNVAGRKKVTSGKVCTRDAMKGPSTIGDPCGDIRLTAVPPYAAGSTVQAGDDDEGAILSNYPQQSPHYHSTHVAGTMIGAGTVYRGVAPAAGLISHHVKWLGNAVDLSPLPDEHAAAVSAGATIANNSWGMPKSYCALPAGASGYDTHSTLNDALASGYDSDGTVATARRMLLVFSAGNRNKLECRPDPASGGPNPVPLGLWRTVQVPNSAKNVLTVANVAPDSALPPAVLSHDSLRGPTGSPHSPLLDGRLKPDISAPGRERANYSGVMSSVPPRNLVPAGGYSGDGGTSMAAPAVSGSAALLTEWYRRACDASGPTPDLLRAVLVHTADDVQTFLTGTFSNQVVDTTPRIGPDYGSGYGMVDVAKAVEVMMRHRRGALSDAGPVEYPLSVGEVAELKVTLAWDDPPYPCLCDEGAVHGLLQNDLDVVLIDPAGNKHAPWQLDPAAPGSGAAPSGPVSGDISPYLDHRNTIEQIVVTDPVPGVWKISVSASQFNSVFAEQQFAIVSESLSPAHGDPAYCPGTAKTDIWLRDNAADVGSTPSAAPLYLSPDVWNRLAADGGTAHQNPQAGATNYMYATLRNDRPLPATAHAVSLELWFAAAATGLNWPQDFGLVERVDVPLLQPGEVRTLGPIPWLAPSPQPSDHFCFYVRAMSPQDPIAVAETGALGTNVASSNNLAWRNVNVVDLDAASAMAQDIDFQIAAVVATPPGEAGREEMPVDIELIVPKALLAAARMQIELHRDLERRWRAAAPSIPLSSRHVDAEVVRPAETADPIRTIRHQRTIFENLPLHRGERFPVHLTLEPTPSLVSGTYAIEVRQHQRGAVVGGIVYEIKVP